GADGCRTDKRRWGCHCRTAAPSSWGTAFGGLSFGSRGPSDPGKIRIWQCVEKSGFQTLAPRPRYIHGEIREGARKLGKVIERDQPQGWMIAWQHSTMGRSTINKSTNRSGLHRFMNSFSLNPSFGLRYIRQIFAFCLSTTELIGHPSSLKDPCFEDKRRS